MYQCHMALTRQWQNACGTYAKEIRKPCWRNWRKGSRWEEKMNEESAKTSMWHGSCNKVKKGEFIQPIFKRVLKTKDCWLLPKAQPLHLKPGGVWQKHISNALKDKNGNLGKNLLVGQVVSMERFAITRS